MRHVGTKPLETGRLLLRPLTAADAADMFRNWAGDDEVTKYLTWPTHADESVSLGFISSIDYENPTTYQWGIELKELGQVIGNIGMVSHRDAIEMAHIGYCMGRTWWNQGVMTEAFGAVIRFFFEEVGINRIESRYDTRNLGSGKVMEKCGLTYEGTFRQGDWNNQGVCDVAHYAILREDSQK